MAIPLFLLTEIDPHLYSAIFVLFAIQIYLTSPYRNGRQNKTGQNIALEVGPRLSHLIGVLMAAAFPPLPLGFLACISLLPLIPVAENLRGRVAFGAGFLQGIIFYSATIYWIAWITPPGMAGAIFYLAVF